MPAYNGKTGSAAWSEYLEKSGFLEALKAEGQDMPLPIHNYELLKAALEERYQKQLIAYLDDRKSNGFIDNQSDIARFRLMWLNDILSRNVESWLNPIGVRAAIQKQRTSDRIELEKYKDYLLVEINSANSAIKPPKTKKTSERETLLDYFESPAKYPIIMGLLVERGFIQAGTWTWIDTGSGYKQLVIRLIKHLHAQGFYENNKRPSSEEMMTIAQKTFGVDISFDTAKRTKNPVGEKHNLDFIRPASTY